MLFHFLLFPEAIVILSQLSRDWLATLIPHRSTIFYYVSLKANNNVTSDLSLVTLSSEFDLPGCGYRCIALVIFRYWNWNEWSSIPSPSLNFVVLQQIDSLTVGILTQRPQVQNSSGLGGSGRERGYNLF